MPSITVPQKRLIEVSLPLEVISKQSTREKFIRHEHISTFHICWARHPTAMRAAIFTSIIPAPRTERECKELKDLIKVIVDRDRVKNGSSEAIVKARCLFNEAYPDLPPKLIDSFKGVATTPQPRPISATQAKGHLTDAWFQTYPSMRSLHAHKFPSLQPP